MESWYQSSQMGWLTPLAARHTFLENRWASITSPVGQSGVWSGRRLRTQQGVKMVGLALAHLASCKASSRNVAERPGSGSSLTCLQELWTPREDFQPGYSRGSPRCKSRSERSRFAYLFYFFPFEIYLSTCQIAVRQKRQGSDSTVAR